MPEKKSEARGSSPTKLVDRFFEDTKRTVQTIAETADSSREDLFGAVLFAVDRDGGVPPFPVSQIDLFFARNLEERKDTAKSFGQMLGSKAENDVQVFLLAAEGVMRKEGQEKKECIFLSAQDKENNYRFKIYEIDRSGRKIALKDLGWDVGWTKTSNPYSPISSLEKETGPKDLILATAWREYIFAKMISGIDDGGEKAPEGSGKV